MNDNTLLSRGLDPVILNKIDLFLEEIYPQSIKLGKLQSRDKKLSITQIRGMENKVNSASRFTEIINYIKNQTGKDKEKLWPQFAQQLLEQLDQLELKAKELGGENAETVLEIKLRLARGWVRQIVCHYLYESIMPDVSNQTDSRDE